MHCFFSIKEVLRRRRKFLRLTRNVLRTSRKLLRIGPNVLRHIRFILRTLRKLLWGICNASKGTREILRGCRKTNQSSQISNYGFLYNKNLGTDLKMYAVVKSPSGVSLFATEAQRKLRRKPFNKLVLVFFSTSVAIFFDKFEKMWSDCRTTYILNHSQKLVYVINWGNLHFKYIAQ